MAQVKKTDLIKILVEEYGYEKEDLKFDSENKPYTNAKLQAIIEAEKQDAKQLEIEATRVKAPASTYKDNDKIYVMSGLSDTLVYHSERTNKTWTFNKFGDQDTIEYSELITMRNRYPRFFTECWLIVLDKKIQDEFKLTDMYQNILTPENIENVFDMKLEDLEKFVDSLPEGQKISFVNKAQQKVEDGSLDSNKVIKFIEEKFNFRFEDNAPLEDVIDSREQVGSAKLIIVDKK